MEESICDIRRSSKKESKAIEGWEYFIIEANPNPYLDQKSEFAMAAAKYDLKYPQLIERIIELAMER